MLRRYQKKPSPCPTQSRLGPSSPSDQELPTHVEKIGQRPGCRRELLCARARTCSLLGGLGTRLWFSGPPGGATPLACGCRTSRRLQTLPFPPLASGSLGTLAHLLHTVAGCPPAPRPAGAPSADTSPGDPGPGPADPFTPEVHPRARFAAHSKGRRTFPPNTARCLDHSD